MAGTPLERFNALAEPTARAELERCCGSSKWVEGMLTGRPFESWEAVLSTGDQAFEILRENDWLEAFRHHPKIGDIASLREKFAATAAWAGGEQAGTAGASEAVLLDLAAGNAAYEARFGFIFIICASGKTAAAMLAALQARLPNDAATELPIAANEQRKITRLRLEKLLSPAAQ